MKIIPVSVQQGESGPVNVPSQPIPPTAVLIECDGINYTIYEEGDPLP